MVRPPFCIMVQSQEDRRRVTSSRRDNMRIRQVLDRKGSSVVTVEPGPNGARGDARPRRAQHRSRDRHEGWKYGRHSHGAGRTAPRSNRSRHRWQRPRSRDAMTSELVVGVAEDLGGVRGRRDDGQPNPPPAHRGWEGANRGRVDWRRCQRVEAGEGRRESLSSRVHTGDRPLARRRPH